MISCFYYINLDRRKDRLRSIKQELEKAASIKDRIERYPAIDGRLLNIDDVSEKIIKNRKTIETVKSKRYTHYGITLTYGSLACAISHYNLFKLCAENNIGDILIFEDDISIPHNIDIYLDKINNCRIYYDIFYLGIHRHKNTKINSILGYRDIFSLSGIFWGGFAYVLTPRACSYIIQNVFPISKQFDSEINTHINSGNLKALYFGQNIVKVKSFQSDNQGKNGLINNYKTDTHLWDDLFA